MKQSKKDVDRIVSFILKANRLKDIKRTGWVRDGIVDPESVGDHSFSTALLSYIMGLRLRIDANKCMAMALIHDINEAITGDIATRLDERDQEMSNKLKHELEHKNAITMYSMLDKKSSKYIINLWKELCDNKTKEAKLVHQVDALDYILQIAIYYHQLKGKGYGREFFATARKRITNPDLLYIYNKIKKKVYNNKEEQIA